MAKIFVPVGHSLLVAKLNRVMYQGKKQKSQIVRWSVVPVAPVLVYVSVMVRGAAANDLCLVSFEA